MHSKALLIVIVLAAVIFVYFTADFWRPHIQPIDGNGDGDGNTLNQGVAPVTLEDDSPHGTTNEQWVLNVVVSNDIQTGSWICQFGGETGVPIIESSDDTTITMYSEGMRLQSNPTGGYRKLVVDETFNAFDSQHHGVQRGDVIEMFAQSPKAYWSLKGNPIVSAGFDVMYYYIPCMVNFYRGGVTYEGYGYFSHSWGKFTQYASQITSWSLIFVLGDKCFLSISHSEGSVLNVDDGGILFMDDMSYDVLGANNSGYAYQIVDGPNCDNFTITVQTHRGILTFNLQGIKRVAGSGSYFQTFRFMDVDITGAMTFKAFVAVGETARR